MKKLLLFLTFLFASVCMANSAEYGGTLIFGRSGDATSLDPSHTTDGESHYPIRNIYDTLVQFEYGTTKIEPGLATKWEISEDGLTYTFHLRKGVYFHTTKFWSKKVEMTSKDVVWSFKRQYDKNEHYNKVGGSFKYWLNMGMSDIIKDVVAKDKYTVVFTLHKPEAPFLANLCMEFTSILSKDYADFLASKSKENDLNRKPVGTGPFSFLAWVKDDKIILQGNKEYWNNKPYLDKLIFKVIPNNAVRAAALKAGAIHVMDFPNPAEISELKKDPNIKFVEQEGLNIGYLSFNMEHKPFDNLLVRQAISHAIDTQAIINSVYEGLGKVAINPIPPTMWGYNKDLKGYSYDEAKAKELLAKAGYKDGFETTLWAMPVARPYMPNAKKIGEIIQAQLAKIGIKVKLVSYDWGTYLHKVEMGEHDMVLLGWTGDNGDPDNFLNVLLSANAAKKPAQNNAFWINKEFSDLIDEARITSDINKREKLYKQAMKIFEQDAPWKPIAHSIVVEPMLKNVHGFKLDPVGLRRFKDVWISK